MKKILKAGLQSTLNNSALFPLNYLFSPIYSGIGTVVMFHRVVPDETNIVCEDLEITKVQLEKTIQYFIDKNYEVVSIGKAYEIITGKVTIDKKFVVFTFDDGYLDNYTVAYPVFKKYQVPFTIYVTTCFPEKKAIIWWYALKELIEQSDELSFCFEHKDYHYRIDTLALKNQVYPEIRRFILNTNKSQQIELFQRLFYEKGIDLGRFVQELAMDWIDIIKLSRDELVTIGAHTVSHCNLKNLDPGAVRREMIESKERIEFYTGNPVEHFAFPFGSAYEAGEREFRIARDAGFQTSTTTRSGNIFAEHGNFTNCLPRITPSPNLISSFPYSYASGFIPALNQRFKRVITN